MIKKILIILMLTGCQTSYLVNEDHEVIGQDKSFCIKSECEDRIFWTKSNK